MSLFQSDWAWGSTSMAHTSTSATSSEVPVASTSKTPFSYSPSSPAAMSSPLHRHLDQASQLELGGGVATSPSDGSRCCDEQAHGTGTTSRILRPPISASSSSSSSSTSMASTSSASSTSTATHNRTSKSDAFFSSYGGFSTSSLPPIKPPSPIVARRASESCLPPPCAAPSRPESGHTRARSSFSAFGSGISRFASTSNKKDKSPTLPDIKEQRTTGSLAPSLQACSYAYSPNKGLGLSELKLAPPQDTSGSSSSSTSPSVYSADASAQTSPKQTSDVQLQDNDTLMSAPTSRHTRQPSVEDTDARLQAAISNLRTTEDVVSMEEGEDLDDDDMYNDAPSSSSTCIPSSGALLQPAPARRRLRSFFEDSDDTGDDEAEDACIMIERVADARAQALEEASHAFDDNEFDYDDDQDYPSDTLFVPFYPLQPLEVIYTPQHRILRRRSLKRALSDSVACHAPSSCEIQPADRQQRRKVSFAASVHVVDVFAAADYPARRGPPPVEKLSMRDVLELRQIKLELASHMHTDQNVLEASPGAFGAGSDPLTRMQGSSQDIRATLPLQEQVPGSAAISLTPATPTQEKQDLGLPLVIGSEQEDVAEDSDARTSASSYDSSAGFSSVSLEPCTSTASSFSSHSGTITTVSTSSSASIAPCAAPVDAQAVLAACAGEDDADYKTATGFERSYTIASDSRFAFFSHERNESREASPDSVLTLPSCGYSSPSLSGSLSCSPSTSDSEFGGAFSEDAQPRAHVYTHKGGYARDDSSSPDSAKTPTRSSMLRLVDRAGHELSTSPASVRRSSSAEPGSMRSKTSEFFDAQLPDLSLLRHPFDLSLRQDS